MLVDIPNYDERETIGTQIIIHPYDTWSMDDTLALIILPMLKQLKATKHGAPSVSLKDVPESLWPVGEKGMSKPYQGETDENYFKRWDYVLDEMIWAFEQKTYDHWEEQYYGPYIEGKNGSLGSFEWVDNEGLKAHQERMTNGFRLFGKYYEGLWD